MAAENYRDLPPVKKNVRLQDALALSETGDALRQTLLRHMDSCARSAYLMIRHGEGVPAHELNRGIALHLVAERMMRDWMEAGETYGGEAGALSEMTGALVDEVLDAHDDLPLRHTDADAVRAMAYHLAVGTDVDPGTVLGVERDFRAEVAGEAVSARVDLLYEIDPETLGIDDYKSGYPQSQEDYEFGMYGFQARMYAWIATVSEMGSYKRVRCRALWPRQLRDDGLVMSRELWLDKQRLQEFGRDLERLVLRLKDGLATGRWPAISGSHCNYCPMEPECPIPASYRRWRGQITEPWMAGEALEWSEVMGKRVTETRREARAFVEKHGPLEVGDEVIYDIEVTEGQKVKQVRGKTDYDGMAAALEAGTFRREDWIRPQTRTALKRWDREAWMARHRTGA